MPNLPQSNFSSGELAPSLHARPTLQRYATGLHTCRNCIVRPEGGVVNRSGTRFLGETKYPYPSNVRLIPFEYSSGDTYMLEFGASYMRIWRNSERVTEFVTASVTTISQAAQAIVTYTAHGFSNDDLIYLTGVNGMAEVNRATRPYRVEKIDVNNFYLKDGTAYIDSSAYTAYVSGGTIYKVTEIATPFTSSHLPNLNYVQDANVMSFAHPDVSPRELTRTSAHSGWALTVVSFAPDIAKPTGLTLSVAGTGNAYNYTVTAVAEETYEESLPADTPINVNESGGAFTWTAVPGALQYNIYKEVNGIYGYIGSTAAGTELYTDASNVPLPDDTPPEARDPFSGVGNYPSVVAYHEQRIVYAATDNEPETIWASQVGNPHNFNTSFPAKESDAITVRVVAQKVNRPRGLASANDLVVLTTGSEFALMTGDSPFIIGNLRRKQQSEYGSRDLHPVIVGGNILFVTSLGGNIRTLSSNDFSTKYAGQDITALARHLFRKKTVVDWGYEEHPDSVVWVIQSDGGMVGVTYLPEHDIVGWHRHDTDGDFKNIASVREGDNLVTYVTTERSSWPYPLIERFEQRDFLDTDDLTDAWFVDSGLTYSGSPVTTVSGLFHLVGKEVAVLADGNVHPNVTVAADGSITLTRAASEIIVGLPYVSHIRTLEPPVLEAFGNVKAAARVILGVEDSRGISVGPTLDNMAEVFSAPDFYDSPLPLQTDNLEFTIDPDMQQRGQLWVEQTYPLPMHILSVIPDYEAEPRE